MTAFREVIIEFEGKEYTISPSMKMLRAIEGSGVSLAAMANNLAEGKPQISHVAYVLYHMLKSSGADVSEDSVYFAIMGASQDQSTAWLEAVVKAFAPGALDEKKPDAPTKKTAKSGTK